VTVPNLRTCRSALRVVLAIFAAAPLLVSTAFALPPDSTLRAWVADMKTAPRGPFVAIRWFCNDGTVRMPRSDCERNGGGLQHGLRTERVDQMRDGGFEIVNIIAELDGRPFVGPTADLPRLKQILMERFLIGVDNGWVMRVTRTYPGSLQAEDEEVGSERILAAMFADPLWAQDDRFYLLRETVRLLPRLAVSGNVTASDVRARAMNIAQADRTFETLRVKIHNTPDASDADRVREFAASRGSRSLYGNYMRLAEDIDTLYSSGAAAEVKGAAMLLPQGRLREQLLQRAELLATDTDPEERLGNASDLMALIRERHSAWKGLQAQRAMFEASLALEDEVYAASTELTSRVAYSTRRQRLEWLWYLNSALYGSGLLSASQVASLRESTTRLAEGGAPSVGRYKEEVSYLGRAPEWAGRTLAYHFGDTQRQFARIEPLANLYPQDRLRGSPMLFYGRVIDSLSHDATADASASHELFGKKVGVGLRALNPGLARGTLRVPGYREASGDYDPNGIYLLPETTADLPPVAGILTEGEGSSLSHIQLLARNLGIPNVVVNRDLIAQVRARAGDPVVLAVSPGGIVQLALDGPPWDAIFGAEAKSEFVIRPDLGKLDLETTTIVPLSSLQASDSGRIAGPKSANLGELRGTFGETVPDGFVIPFGAFRKLLDRPIEPGGPSVFDWMKEEYRYLATLKGDPEAHKRATNAFLARMRSWIENVEPGPEFRAELHQALLDHFGADGTYGVFVRSDTNVEDLPGFTGAGLNLTVPNVVGEAAIVDAIRRVWASPFTERAYAWRQAHMPQPEYVFPGVLVQLAFPSEKSGVMVTADVDGRRAGFLSIAVNEGVGGAVDGQAAESLLVSSSTSEARLLSSATATKRRVLAPSGGIIEIPVRGGRVLQQGEIRQLVELAKKAETFPALQEEGKVMPADIEFAFRDGRLALLQIRPFVESKGASESGYLKSLDAANRAPGGEARVALDAVPVGG